MKRCAVSCSCNLQKGQNSDGVLLVKFCSWMYAEIMIYLLWVVPVIFVCSVAQWCMNYAQKVSGNLSKFEHYILELRWEILYFSAQNWRAYGRFPVLPDTFLCVVQTLMEDEHKNRHCTGRHLSVQHPFHIPTDARIFYVAIKELLHHCAILFHV